MGREHTMKASEVNSWLGHQGDQSGDGRSCASLRPRHTVHPVHKVQWFKQDVGGAIAVGCFELIAHPAVPSHRQALGGYRGPGADAIVPKRLSTLHIWTHSGLQDN